MRAKWQTQDFPVNLLNAIEQNNMIRLTQPLLKPTLARGSSFTQIICALHKKIEEDEGVLNDPWRYIHS